MIDNLSYFVFKASPYLGLACLVLFGWNLRGWHEVRRNRRAHRP
jgi:hypothetical protein